MIHREDRDAVSILRMEHGKANAVDIDLFHEMNRRLDEVEGSARAVVLTGTGSMFSAGVNLFKILEGGERYVEEFLPLLATSVRRLFGFPLPVVAAVNGHAIAGGCILAAACDHRVMGDGGGKIGVTELLVGVPFPTAALEVLRYLLPEREVQSLVYSGRTLSAGEAQAIGLADEVTEPEAVLERACDAARRLAAIPGDAFALTKSQLRRSALDRIDARSPQVDPAVLEIWSSDATMAAIKGFLERAVGKKG